MSMDVRSPVAILDKELTKYPSYAIETYELCDCCGARFAIGYRRADRPQANKAADLSEISREGHNALPNRLREMLTEDHGHDRQHKHFTEIWI